MAIKSAELSELALPKDVWDGTLAAYDAEIAKGKAEATLIAMAGLSRLFIERKSDDRALRLADAPPEWREGKIDFTLWCFASQALLDHETAWQKWHEPVKNALMPHPMTAKDGCVSGSWAPDGDPRCAEGGRVYATPSTRSRSR